ncbi:hypothetical protein GCM10009133_32430 [Cocleimonas flava]|uniref:Peptidoglycan-associated lipoprotein n=1 Tax=Cocleimonas flava TaxID=634765 RepID=A0A4R1FDI7_9GAMM|nr:OmpA family protein [Cocleimonas flava]TCJ88911.1 peptidoglycan-associated lipoprotein [Cocleimonas flava]
MRSIRTKLVVLPILLSALTIVGCSSQNVDKDTTADGSITSSTTTEDGTKTGTVGAGGASGVNSKDSQGDRSNFNYLPGENNGNNTNDITLAGLNNPDNLLSQRIIYFDYDKAAIRPEYMVLINTHAKLLAKYPSLKMRLEGHADERGSRAYNVALSESRAQSVKNIMGVQGALSSQIKTIGYGEEIPIVRGQSQESWQKNRRVEIKYDDY